MKPIPARRHFREEVKYDKDKHGMYETPTVFEDRYADGVVTDIISLMDAGIDPSKKDSTIMQREGVYVVFWEEFDDCYKLRVEDVANISSTHNTIRNYVSSSK